MITSNNHKCADGKRNKIYLMEYNRTSTKWAFNSSWITYQISKGKKVWISYTFIDLFIRKITSDIFDGAKFEINEDQIIRRKVSRSSIKYGKFGYE